jgi:hypothetical protein
MLYERGVYGHRQDQLQGKCKGERSREVNSKENLIFDWVRQKQSLSYEEIQKRSTYSHKEDQEVGTSTTWTGIGPAVYQSQRAALGLNWLPCPADA